MRIISWLLGLGLIAFGTIMLATLLDGGTLTRGAQEAAASITWVSGVALIAVPKKRN